MPYTKVTWESGDILTSAKLNAMDDNDALKNFRYGDALYVRPDAVTETHTTNYYETWKAYFYLPDGDRGSAIVSFLAYGVGTGTGYMKVNIDSNDTYSATWTTVTTSHVQKTATIDISALAEGWHTVSMWGYVSGFTGMGTYAFSINLAGE
jgi:hypothetical protein